MSRHDRRTAGRQRGFTLIETLIATGIAGILSSIAYPSFEGQVLRARRSDALVALLEVQLAEERYRADHARYGNLAETGSRAASAGGHYTLQVVANDADGYDLLASAAARQAHDTNCRHLRLSSLGAALVYASGPDATTGNGADLNRKCWNQ